MEPHFFTEELHLPHMVIDTETNPLKMCDVLMNLISHKDDLIQVWDNHNSNEKSGGPRIEVRGAKIIFGQSHWQSKAESCEQSEL